MTGHDREEQTSGKATASKAGVFDARSTAQASAEVPEGGLSVLQRGIVDYPETHRVSLGRCRAWTQGTGVRDCRDLPRGIAAAHGSLRVEGASEEGEAIHVLAA